jgi:metal-responsive CopG/Arc/MetJ family transcriptional regulator
MMYMKFVGRIESMRKSFTISIEEELLDEIDEQRDLVNRSRFIERLIQKGLKA